MTMSVACTCAMSSVIYAAFIQAMSKWLELRSEHTWTLLQYREYNSRTRVFLWVGGVAITKRVYAKRICDACGGNFAC